MTSTITDAADDMLSFADLDAFAMRTVERTPSQIAREEHEAAKGRAAADAYDAAIASGATPEAARKAARKAAAIYAAEHPAR